MQTVLNLLTRDGAIQVAFTSQLTARQYDLLLEVVKEAASAAQLQHFLEEWAQQQRLTVTFH